MIDTARFMEYAHIDEQGEGDTLKTLLEAAEETICETTGKVRPPIGSDTYDLAVMMLAAHWYDNRTPTSEAYAEQREIPYTMQWLINYISLCSLFPEKEAKG